MVIKIPKMSHFFVFMLIPAKNQSQFGQNIYAHLKNLIFLSENAMDCWILRYHYQDINPGRYKVSLLLTQQRFGISTLDISQT